MKAGSVVLVAGGVFAFGFLSGWMAGGRPPGEREADSRPRAPSAPRTAEVETSRSAPGDAAALARIEAELRALRAEVEGLRAARGPSAPPVAAREGGPGEMREAVERAFASGGSIRPWGGGPESLRTEMERLGLSPSQQAEAERSIREERERILERFKASVPADQWEAYRTARAKGPHRATQEDWTRIREVEDHFKRVQEQVISESASRFAGLGERERNGVERLRGGFLNVGEDGGPSVESAPSGVGMTFRTYR